MIYIRTIVVIIVIQFWFTSSLGEETHLFSPQDQSLRRSSIIDDCCCDVEHLKHSNAEDLNPLLNRLMSTRFFKYFKTDLHAECPFWVSNAVCTLAGCSICECTEDEIPTYWRLSKTDHVDVNMPENFVAWRDDEYDIWSDQGHEERMSYVNLEKYPEGNTGYRDGALIWNRIYNENCFTGKVDKMCLEERIFFRLISGIHTSITIHVARNFDFEKITNQWMPNLQMYSKAIRPFQDRIGNLYFSYLFLLRAVTKAGPFLKEYAYHTGDEAEELEVKMLVNRMLSVDLLCEANFDESILFSDPAKEDLKHQLKSHLRNISLIMNCVSCEKCKVWAKLQTLGVGTAFKILLASDLAKVIHSLQRNEIIALFNTLRQMSDSIKYVDEMTQMLENPDPIVNIGTLDSFPMSGR